MKFFSSLVLLICLFYNSALFAQDTGVACDQSFNYKVEKNEYGNYVLQVRPYVKAPCGHPLSDMEKKYKLWGVLVCYTVDGQQKVKRQDMTYDIKTKGFFQVYLSYSEDSPVKEFQLFFFDASKDPSTYPEKSCSFFEKK